MPVQQLNINTDTIYTTAESDDQTLTVLVQASDVTPNTVQATLNFDLRQFHVNNLEVMPGELLMVLKNSLKNVSFEIDNDGNLIVNASDANNYSINSEGYLIYTYR